jgi:hypothetical protein
MQQDEPPLASVVVCQVTEPVGSNTQGVQPIQPSPRVYVE